MALFFSRNQFLAIFANYVILWKDLAFILTLLLNLLIILSFFDGEPTLSEEDRFFIRSSRPQLLKNMSYPETKDLFTYCGYVMIVCSTFVVVFFLCKKAPLYIREAWNNS